MRPLAFILLAVLAGSCRASLEGAECPCVDGYYCDDSENVCKPGEEPVEDAGAADAGPDDPDAQQGIPDGGFGVPDADLA